MFHGVLKIRFMEFILFEITHFADFAILDIDLHLRVLEESS